MIDVAVAHEATYVLLMLMFFVDDYVNVDVGVNVYVVYADDNGDANVNVDIDCMKRETVWNQERLCDEREVAWL